MDMFCTLHRLNNNNMRIVCFAACQLLFNFCYANSSSWKDSYQQQLLINANGLQSKITDQLSPAPYYDSKESGEGICLIAPREVRMNRYATKMGFHRDLHSSVSMQPGVSNNCTTCELLLIESLPSGLYVDLHQAAEAVHFGGPKIVSFEDIDVEKPAYLSEGHTILVYHPRPSRIKFLWVNFTMELVVHLRYHRPSLNLSAHMISLQAPYVLFRCLGTTGTAARKTKDGNEAKMWLYRAPCDGTNKTSCLWQLLPQKHMELHFEVPVGKQKHTFIVTMVTVLATILGVVILLVAMTRSPKDKPD